MKNRYWFISIIFLLLLCVYLFNYSYDLEQSRKIDEITGHQKIHAKQAVRSFNALFEKWQDVLVHLSDDNDIIIMSQRGKEEFSSLVDLFGEEINGITRVSSKGIILYTYPEFPGLIGADISHQKHMEKILKDHEPVISDVFDAVQGYKAIAIHYPLFRNNKFDGTIAFVLNFEKIAKEILDDIKIGKSGYAWLISGQGVELYCPIPGHIGKPVSETTEGFPELQQLAEKMIAGKEGVAKYHYNRIGPQTKPVEKIAYYVPLKIGNTFWSLAITYSQDEITASLIDFRNKLIIIFSLVFIGGAFLSFFSVKALIVVKETDARQKVENQLVESEKKYRMISSVASDYMFSSRVMKNNKLQLEWVEGAFEAITGYTFEEYVESGGWRAALHPDDKEQDNADMEKLSSNNPVITEIRTITKDGSTVWVRVYAQPVWDDKQNRLTGIYGAVQNITERKQAEETVKILSSVVEQSRLEIIITDLSGKIEYANGRVTEITGYSTSELLGEKTSIFKSGQMDDSYYKSMWETVLSGSDWSGEFLNKKKSGELYWESALISPLKDKKGEITHLIGIKEDITEKKNLVQELLIAKENAEKSDRLKSEFLAQMSHEIRTPVNSILSFSSLLEEEVYDSVGEDLKQCFSLIYSAGKRIIRTIDMLLNMSELITDSYEYYPKEIHLFETILDSLIKEYYPKADEKGLKLELKKETQDDSILADEYTVIQIFQNLLDNALKYTEKGKVEVICKSDDTKVCVEIKDTGIGINKEYINSIFEPFTQEQQGYTRKYEGNGLGLALVKKYCELNNAEIKIESEKGKGSTFTVVFSRNGKKVSGKI